MTVCKVSISPICPKLFEKELGEIGPCWHNLLHVLCCEGSRIKHTVVRYLHSRLCLRIVPSLVCFCDYVCLFSLDKTRLSHRGVLTLRTLPYSFLQVSRYATHWEEELDPAWGHC